MNDDTRYKEKWTFVFTFGRSVTVYGADYTDCKRRARERAKWAGFTDRLGRTRVCNSWQVREDERRT